VVKENAQLRNLLAKYGIGGQEIDEFLRSESQVDPERRLIRDETGMQAFLSPRGGEDSKYRAATHGQALWSIQLATPPSSSQHEVASAIQHDTGSPISNHCPAVIPEPLPLSGSRHTNGESNCGAAYPSLNRGSLAHILHPSVPDWFCPELPHDQSAQDETERMSCKAAASIIAGMRGHGDSELALRELGCEPDVNCQIKNVRVMQVMDAD
jgi:hypothetical protein